MLRHIRKYLILGLLVLLVPMYVLFSMTQAQSSDEILKKSWENYKAKYIEPNGAVRRPDQGNDVVSEGVAYAMLRAVWVQDQETFDRVYDWTEKNMSRKNNPDLDDNLLGWKYTNGVADWGAASDADLDYALALAFASKTWDKPSRSDLEGYAAKSIAVQTDILNLATGKAGGKLHLQPGTWNMFTAPITVNPSYLSPGHYKIFNAMKPDARWLELTDTAYELLWKSSNDISGTRGVGLPPNWVQVNDDGSVSKASNFDINYTYDAFRTSWRVALDYMWFSDERAKNYLTKSGARDLMLKQFKDSDMIFAEYSHDGNVMGRYDNAGVYGVNVGWFIPENRDVVEKFAEKMEVAYSNNNGFFVNDSYYMENWGWLGYAMATNSVPNMYNGGIAPKQDAQQLFDAVIGEALEHSMVESIQTDAIEYITGLEILNPKNGNNLGGQVQLQVFNDDPTTVGTWWSVDSGSWVSMQKSNVENVWASDINLSGWTWKQNGEYTIRAWSMNDKDEVKQTKVQIKR